MQRKRSPHNARRSRRFVESLRPLGLASTLLIALIVWATPVPPANAGTLDDIDKISKGYAELVERVRGSVVQIFVTGYAPGTVVGPGGGGQVLSRSFSSGSGVIVDPKGYIVTNAHVVLGGRHVKVRLAKPVHEGGQSIIKSQGVVTDAEIVGIDTETDLAVLKIDEEGLTALSFGDSEAVQQGNLVFAFGSPFQLENTVSMGVVSAVARQFQPDDPMIYIQTDAPINPGNSGGALVNTRGELVGINTLILSLSGGSQGLGFAAPSNIVRAIYRQIQATGRVQRGVIGVNAQTISPVMARALGLPQSWGVIIGDVYPQSPAELAGLKRGDVILSLDGKRMENGRQFNVNVYRRTVGQAVKLEVMRGGEKRNFNVPVVDRPDNPSRFAGRVHPSEHQVDGLGILGIELDEELGRMIPGLRSKQGVVVALIGTERPLAEFYLQPGDIILSLNGTSVNTLEGLRGLVSPLGTGDAVVLQIERGGRYQYVDFEME